ncbi:hypothetical protein IGJ55_002161 [Enterococcus sp. AZ170]|uniref:nucleoside-triphosphatase n=1 Tax=Enterococcus sp. AZ170 TaxID=2774747 RepID=UPI003D300F00
MNSLFLEGNKFIGKSTLLQKVLRLTCSSVNGFYVNRIINDGGQIIAFELRAAKELLQQKAEMKTITEHCFIQTREGKRIRNLFVFETFGIELLKEIKKVPADVVLLDEIGGIELLSEPFLAELLAVVRHSNKIVGVFKSERNYQHQKQLTIEKLEVNEQRVLLKREIYRNQGQLVELKENNLHLIKKRISRFSKKIFFFQALSF